MWAVIKGNLVNLDNVVEISRSTLGFRVKYIGEEFERFFEFDNKEEQEKEFNKLTRLVLKEE
ncbi:MAG TPA: hypothetical protein PKN66_09605 [Thermodesulfovibrio thiophilus]|nr:hypothetical protein [Thermodesulfovibrio thiophilus]